MIDNFAWIGTGPCDPNKGLIEVLVLTGVLVGWAGIILLIKKLLKSSKSKIFRYASVAFLIVAGIVGTILAWGVTWLTYACSGY